MTAARAVSQEIETLSLESLRHWEARYARPPARHPALTPDLERARFCHAETCRHCATSGLEAADWILLSLALLCPRVRIAAHRSRNCWSRLHDGAQPDVAAPHPRRAAPPGARRVCLGMGSPHRHPHPPGAAVRHRVRARASRCSTGWTSTSGSPRYPRPCRRSCARGRSRPSISKSLPAPTQMPVLTGWGRLRLDLALEHSGTGGATTSGRWSSRAWWARGRPRPSSPPTWRTRSSSPGCSRA